MTPILAAALILCADPRIIDGDSLACSSGERVRIWGIDAPERHDPGGPEATAYMRQLTLGKPVICEPKGTDRYRRTVALCRVNGSDLAAKMVRAGHARDWPKFSHGWYSKDAPK